MVPPSRATTSSASTATEQGTENEDANEEEADVQVEDEVTYSQTIGNVVVTATVAKDVLPGNGEFVVTPIVQETDPDQYAETETKLNEKLRKMDTKSQVSWHTIFTSRTVKEIK